MIFNLWTFWWADRLLTNFVDYHKVGNTLVFVTSEFEKFFKFPVPNQFENLVLEENVILPPNSINFISVLTSNNSIQIPVMNFDPEPKSIAKGTVIERAEVTPLPVVQKANVIREPVTIEDIIVDADQPEEVH